MDEKPTPRRNAAATREAILQSALAAFTQSGYDGVGVRDIASGAGVTAMLVNRYFGSKEGLFAEVVELALSRKGILTAERTTTQHAADAFAQEVAAAIVAQTDPAAPVLEGFLVMLRSAANPRAAEILREKFERHFAEPLARLLPGAHAAERAALFLSLIAGFQLMRQLIGTSALAQARPAWLTGQLAAQLQLLARPHTKG